MQRDKRTLFPWQLELPESVPSISYLYTGSLSSYPLVKHIVKTNISWKKHLDSVLHLTHVVSSPASRIEDDLWKWSCSKVSGATIHGWTSRSVLSCKFGWNPCLENNARNETPFTQSLSGLRWWSWLCAATRWADGTVLHRIVPVIQSGSCLLLSQGWINIPPHL